MRSYGLVRLGLVAFGVSAMSPLLIGSIHAAAPVVTMSATGTRIQVTAASLSEAIDALARTAGFKVTYEGARPGAMLFNAEIDTPTVAQTLFRLLDGQNLNYGVVFDLSGKKVTSLMILGPAPKTGGTPGAAGTGGRPQPFTPPRSTQRDMPPVDDDPVESEPEPAPTPEATPAPSPGAPPRGTTAPGAPPTPSPYSPFAPRPPFGGPFGPRPAPSPSP